MKADHLIKYLIFSSILMALFYLLANPIRLLFIYNVLTPYLAINLLILCCLSFLLLSKINYVRFEILEIVLIGLLFFLLIYSFAVSREYGLLNIALDFLKSLVFFLGVVCIRNFIDLNGYQFSFFLKKLTPSIISITVFVVLLNIFIISNWFPMYPAFSTPESAMVFISNPFSSAMYAVILFVSGKRGVFIGYVLVMSLFFYMTLMSRRRNKIFNYFLLLNFVVVCSAGVYFAQDALLPIFFKVSSINQIQDEGLESLLKLLAGGRDVEIFSSLSSIKEVYSFLLGMGFGFEYLIYGFGDKVGQLHRNVHFSPVSILTMYGFIFASIFYLYLGIYIYRAIFIMREARNEVLFIPFAIYFLVSFIFSFTEYNFFSYSNISISMGIIGARYRSITRYRSIKGT